MSHFSDRTFTSSFGETTTVFNTNDDGVFSVAVNGTFTFTLSHSANGTISGNVVIDGFFDSTVIGGSNSVDSSGGIFDTVAVSGSPSNLTFSSNTFANITFSGAINSQGTLITGSANLVFDNTTGSFGLAVSAVGTTPPGDDPYSVITLPDAAGWDAVAIGDGTRFVGPQFNVDPSTGAWSLASPPPPGSYPESEAAYVSGPDRASYLDAVSQTLAWGSILSRDTGAPQIVQDVYGNASTAVTIFNIETKFIERLFGALDASALVRAGVSGTGSAEIEAQLEAARSGLSSDTRDAARDVAVDAATQGTFAEYLVNFWRSAKLIKHESTEFFTMQTGSEAYVGGAHKDTMIGTVLRDSFAGGLNDDMAIGWGGADILSGDAGRDQLFGGAGQDRLNGGQGVDRLAGDAGNDILNGGGGADQLVGGGGNDTLVWDRFDRRVDGGSGSGDVLKAGTLNLTTISNSLIKGIEVVNMTNGANNTLTLNARDLLDLSSSTNVLKVLGNAGDRIDIVGNFTNASDNLAGFNRYTFGGATLQVDNDITNVF